MKTPSLFAASGNAPFATVADQAARVRSAAEFTDPVQGRRAELTGSLVQLLIQSTPAKNNTPGN